MKTPKQWIEDFSEISYISHQYDCCCKRCKIGKEFFILESDIEAIQQDALSYILQDGLSALILRHWSREKIVNFCNHLLGDEAQQKEDRRDMVNRNILIGMGGDA